MTTTLARLSYQVDRTHMDVAVPWEWDDLRLWVDPAWSDDIDRSLWRAYVIAPKPAPLLRCVCGYEEFNPKREPGDGCPACGEPMTKGPASWRVHLDHGPIRVRLVRVDIEGRIMQNVTPDDALRSAGAYAGPVDYFGLEAVG